MSNKVQIKNKVDQNFKEVDLSTVQHIEGVIFQEIKTEDKSKVFLFNGLLLREFKE